MVEFTNLERPHIDINLCETNLNIQPIDIVSLMNGEEFEKFVVEWLYGFKQKEYFSIKKMGSSGDKGRDIIAYNNDKTVDYYQCKHYNEVLSPSNYYLELGKLCYYTYKKDIPIPKTYYIIASNDIGPSLQDMIDNPKILLLKLVENWDRYCKNKIIINKEIILDDNLRKYIDEFDFSIVQSYPIAKIVDEHLKTVYGGLRFGGPSIVPPTKIIPKDDIDSEEMIYIEALLEAYSDKLKIKIETVENLKKYDRYYIHLKRQRKDYYQAETIRRFVRDILTDFKEFDTLKEEVYDGIIDIHEKDYDDGYERLVADLQQATIINTSKCLLDSKLKYIGISERKGMCHILVNDDKLRWVI